jgi:O-antigen ligase
MSDRKARLEFAGFLLVAACLAVSQFSIALAQIVFTIAAVVWLIVIVDDGRRPAAPPFFVPLLAYSALTLVSAAASLDPGASLWDSRQLLMFLMVPMVARFAQGTRAMSTINVIIALGAAGAIVGVAQFAVFGYDDLSNRPVGALSHYMTYSGVLMLVTCATVARLLFYRKEWIWPAIAVPALLVALAATQARSAWVGTFVALAMLMALRRPRLALLAPVAAALLFAIAPDSIQNRALSIVDLNNPTNRDRVAMVQVGAGIVRDYPVFGVGPEMIEDVYRDYRPPNAVNEVNPHLHNVPVQIAAERGLLALAAWLWFVVAVVRELFTQVRRGPAAAVAAAGLAATVAMLGAGLFEYNFGDSEFLILFLGLITLPWAARHGNGQTADDQGGAP